MNNPMKEINFVLLTLPADILFEMNQFAHLANWVFEVSQIDYQIRGVLRQHVHFTVHSCTVCSTGSFRQTLPFCQHALNFFSFSL